MNGWYYENVQNCREQSAYGVVKDKDGKILFDTLNSDVAEIYTEQDGEGGVNRWDETGKKNLTIASAAPELLESIEELLPYAVEAINRLTEQMVGGLYPSINAAKIQRAKDAISKAYGR